MGLAELIKNLEILGFEIPELSQDTPHEAPIEQIEVPELGLDAFMSVGIDAPVKNFDLRKNVRRRSQNMYIRYKGIAHHEEKIYKKNIDLAPLQFYADMEIAKALKDYLGTLKPSQWTDIDNPFGQGSGEMIDAPARLVFGFLIEMGQLRWFRHGHQDFPYVLTHTYWIDDVGASIGGLYFVSQDAAKTRWQQECVAIHERFCQTRGHEDALQWEKALIDKLRVPKEKYERWRNHIDTRYGFK